MLNGASCEAGGHLDTANGSRIGAPGAPGGAVGATHPRQGRIIDAITRVLSDHGEPMQARAVHAAVEVLLGEAVLWSSVKATLAGNLARPAPRFVRVARGRYEMPPPLRVRRPLISTGADPLDAGSTAHRR